MKCLLLHNTREWLFKYLCGLLEMPSSISENCGLPFCHLRIFWIFVWAFWMLPFNPEEYLCEVLVLLNIWEYWLILVWFACSRKHLRLFSILVWFACFGKYLRFVYISVSCFFWKTELRKLKELCQLHVLENILKYLTEFLFNIYLAVLEINWEYC